MTQSLAARAFAHHVESNNVEMLIGDLLIGIFNHAWSDYSVDYYDESIEVYGVADVTADITALKDAGFARVWVHGGERMGGYPCSLAVDGRCACRCEHWGPR